MPMTPAETIQRIAQIANDTAWQAGVGGMEVAGQFVSILARHPEIIDKFLAEGPFAIDGISMFAAEQGCLTFHRGSDGKVTTPAELHAAREIQKIKKRIEIKPIPPEPDLTARGTCDWGDCDEQASRWRFSFERVEWLVVCDKHQQPKK